MVCGSFILRIRFMLLVMIAILSVGCSRNDYSIVMVDQLVNSAQKSEGMQVKLIGKVVEQMKLPLINANWYWLADDTGKVLVYTDKSMLAKGETIMVVGVVSNLAIFGQKSIGLHLKETERYSLGFLGKLLTGEAKQ